MAKRSKRSSAREPKATSKKPRRQAVEVEVVEEAPGEGIDTAILVVTTLVLLAAILYVDKLRAVIDGGGMFF